ncbi:hypothetical protein GCM10027321_31220 [Massilia terrae]|uniref:Uncharacterized protein n=1 Tax=Massilia terrae TaxID=1811224 RepID=A0ABT2CRE3_9BURK|nr:hypothetical protein [Massilia terrae]MCS0656542.1 hypothetical protein [Massilia terrae]
MNENGNKVVERLARGAVRDDVKGRVRQIVKGGGREQMQRDFIDLIGRATQTRVDTPKGPLRLAELEDGSTVSARGFSSGGQPSIQVNDPNSRQIVKVRYEE